MKNSIAAQIATYFNRLFAFYLRLPSWAKLAVLGLLTAFGVWLVVFPVASLVFWLMGHLVILLGNILLLLSNRLVLLLLLVVAALLILRRNPQLRQRVRSSFSQTTARPSRTSQSVPIESTPVAITDATARLDEQIVCSCGTLNRPEARFCSSCRAPFLKGDKAAVRK